MERERRKPCLLPDFSGIASSFSPFSLTLATGLLYIAFLCLGISLEFLIFPRLLTGKYAEFCQMLYQCLMKLYVLFSFEFVYVVDSIDGFPYI